MGVKINKCPHCGARGILYFSAYSPEYKATGSLTPSFETYQVECAKCRLHGPIADEKKGEDEATAISWWNALQMKKR